MANLILFILSAYAAWYVFSTAELPVWARLREELGNRSVTFYEFLYCPICSGFWVAWALALVFPLTGDLVQWPGGGWEQKVLASLVQAFAGAGAIYLIETHVRRLEER